MNIHDIVGIYALLGIVVFLHPLNISDMKFVWRDANLTDITRVIIFFTIGAISYIAWPVTLYGIIGRKRNG